MTARVVPVSLLFALAFVPSSWADDDKDRDVQVLRDAGIGLDGPALLDYFRKRSATDEQRRQILGLIRQSGHESFAVRRNASRELEAFGITAIGLLKQAQRDPNPEIAGRATRSLAVIEKVPSNLLTTAAARMVGRVQPAGGLETLLDYVPLADDEMAADAIGWSLQQLAIRDGQPEPALITALKDASPERRAISAEALLHAKAVAAFPAVRRLLRDADAEVRMRTAMALAVAAHDKTAIPDLIELLAVLRTQRGLQIETLLFRIAGDDGPKVSLVGGEAIRCRDEWADWWALHGGNVDLAKLDVQPPLFGYTLMILMDATGQGGKVIEYAADGKTIRWQIEGLQMPLDAQVLPHSQRVLLAESNAHMVTERDFQGKIQWRYAINSPIGCERLANGDTFIVTRDQLLQVDARGKTVFTFNRGQSDIVAARKAADGQYVYASRLGKVARVDTQGKEHSFAVPPLYHFTGMQLLPKNHVLLTLTNSVVEYDEMTGQQTWQAPVGRLPVSVARLPNGNTLVASAHSRKIQELDRNGKIVAEETFKDVSPWRVLRR